ncbi:MAG: hypothetical protein JW778_02715 [Candidatus Altiarchaeota archaeon]|nr:hypothetical protein [Candidatus Altiarchaeota archaeon]
MESDLKTLAKYPFLREAKNHVSSLNLTLEQLLNHPVYSSAVDLGRKRVSDALGGRIETNLSDRLSQELTILSYAIARIVVNASSNKILISRYAKAEAQHAHLLLRREPDSVIQAVKEDLDFPLIDEGMVFSSFLKLTKDLTSDPRWKLVNRVMDNGVVRVSKRVEVLVLLREAIKHRIMEPVEVKSFPGEFKAMAKQLTDSAVGPTPRVGFKELDNTALPPCVLRMLSSLESGSASHQVMFILGTFFIGLGLKVDDVVRVFSVSPKFDEEKTRYQLSFLSGEKGSTKYSCPVCEKIKSYGFCVSECNVKHPLQYYRDRTKSKKKTKS